MTDETITFADGRVFQRLESCNAGDYSGSGSVGRANILVLKDQYEYEYHSHRDLFHYLRDYGEFPKTRCYKRDDQGYGYWEDENIILEPETVIVIATCAYDYEQAYMDTAHPDFESMYDRLNDYPVLDEHVWSIQENDEKFEAFTNWIEHDIMRELRSEFEWDEATGDYSEAFEKFEKTWDDTEASVRFSFFENFASDQNEYFYEDGTSGFSFRLDRLDWTTFIEDFCEYVRSYS